MRSHRTTILALAAAIALAGCGVERTTEDEQVVDDRASGSSPERSSAVVDTTPYRPGQPDAAAVPETRP